MLLCVVLMRGLDWFGHVGLKTTRKARIHKIEICIPQLVNISLKLGDKFSPASVVR